MNKDKAEKAIRDLISESEYTDGIKVKGTHIIIDGQPYAMHLVPLKARPTQEGKKEVKEEINGRREYDMLLSVKDNPKKPSKSFAERGHAATSASGVLIGLKKRGLVKKNESTKEWELTEQGLYVLTHKKVEE